MNRSIDQRPVLGPSATKIRESSTAPANSANVAGSAGAFIDADSANATNAADATYTADPDGLTFVDPALPVIERC